MSFEIFTPGGLDYIFGRMLVLGINGWSRYFTTAYHSMKSVWYLETPQLGLEFLSCPDFSMSQRHVGVSSSHDVRDGAF